MTSAATPNKHASKLHRKPKRAGRGDTLDADLEKERLEPGFNSEGTSGAGASPDSRQEDSNSNT